MATLKVLPLTAAKGEELTEPPAPPMSASRAARAAARRDLLALVSYAYGTLLMAGGFLHQAYAHAPSALALYAGLGLGTAIWALERAWFAADSAGLRRANPAFARARTVISALQTAIALALTLDMGRRWALTQLVVPPGLIAGASAAVALLYGNRLAAALGI